MRTFPSSDNETAVSSYAKLETERPKTIRDHTHRWEQLQPLGTVNGTLEQRVRRFCEDKRIRPEALVALDARVKVDKHGGVYLAFAGRAVNGAVTAIKYRPLGGSSHDTKAEAPSVWVRPIVVGQRDSLEWFVAEGETDAARILDLVPETAAVLCLPAGARTFKRGWAELIPRGARVCLCHDADEEGDKGAEKAARIVGGNTVRLRPPNEDGDWCDWDGDRQAFATLVRETQSESERPFALPLDEFIAAKSETPPALVGDETENLLPAFGLLILFAKGGKGKTTMIVDAALHFASGVDWLGFTIARPLRVLFIENEGPREPFRAKLELKRKLWQHELRGAIYVQTFEWGAFTLADNNDVERLRVYCAENEIDVVIGDPLDSLGVDGVGSPEDTRKFMALMGQAGLFRTVAFLLLHHPRKEGSKDELDEVSGAWGGKPDTMLRLDKLDGNRARLSFPKVRWSRRGTRPAYILAFDPDTEGFTVAHEEENEERDYVAELEELLADGVWRIVKEIAAPKEDGGIGANVDKIRAILEGNPDRFLSCNGKQVGRSALATVWQRTQRSESVESVRRFHG
jgi:AAA domain